VAVGRTGKIPLEIRARVRLAPVHAHGPADAARNSHVERSFLNFDAIDLGIIDVKGRWIHPVGASAVYQGAVDCEREVVFLKPAQDYVRADGPPTDVPGDPLRIQRLAEVG
jgi:hypothetical protein